MTKSEMLLELICNSLPLLPAISPTTAIAAIRKPDSYDVLHILFFSSARKARRFFR